MLKQQLQDDVKTAMKARDQVKLDTLRFVLSEIKNAEIDAHSELSDEEVVKVLRKEVKKRQESIEQFKQGSRADLAEAEIPKVAIIESYVPKLMSREDVQKIVDQVVAGGSKDFGAVMGQVMAQTKGQADGKLVSELVKAALA